MLSSKDGVTGTAPGGADWSLSVPATLGPAVSVILGPASSTAQKP